MIDRFGKRILVGWAAHELAWVEAALTLDRKERREAFEDIADMTGRAFASIVWKADQISAARRNEALEVRLSGAIEVLAPARPQPPSDINTSARVMAMRMGARA